jgi:mRNA interferase HigB
VKVVGRKHLEEFANLHADVRPQLEAWLNEVEEADWKEPQKIKERFPGASFLSGNRVVFNLKGNKYRLLTKMSFEVQVVLIAKIGTHAEYSKWGL